MDIIYKMEVKKNIYIYIYLIIIKNLIYYKFKFNNFHFKYYIKMAQIK